MFRYSLNLAAEDIAEAEERASPEERSRGIEQKETPRTHVKDAGQGRGDGAQAGKKLGKQERASALLGKNAFGAANAGIRLKRNLTKKLENPDAFAAAKLIPDGIRCYGSENDVKERGEKIQVAGAGESAGREQQRHRRKRQAYLLGENPSEQQNVSMVETEFERAVHG